MPIDVTINGNERGDSMVYAIITKDKETGREEREDKKGTRSLEKYTDNRILSIHADAIYIFKVYEDNTAIILKGDCC